MSGPALRPFHGIPVSGPLILETLCSTIIQNAGGGALLSRTFRGHTLARRAQEHALIQKWSTRRVGSRGCLSSVYSASRIRPRSSSSTAAEDCSAFAEADRAQNLPWRASVCLPVPPQLATHGRACGGDDQFGVAVAQPGPSDAEHLHQAGADLIRGGEGDGHLPGTGGDQPVEPLIEVPVGNGADLAGDPNASPAAIAVHGQSRAEGPRPAIG